MTKKYEKLMKLFSDPVETTVNNGFPALIWYNIETPDYSVGITRTCVDEMFVTTRNGSDLPFNLSNADRDRCFDVAMKNYRELQNDY